MFWSSSPIWLKVFEDNQIRIVGFVAVYAGLLLSTYSMIHLGRNYSPCYDSHLPFELITSGPYRFIRHPGWLAKALVGIGTLLITGSLWFVPMAIWLIVELRRTIQVEEKYLSEGLPGYCQYRDRTWAMIPMVF